MISQVPILTGLAINEKGGFLIIRPQKGPSEAHPPRRQKQPDISGIDFAIPIQVSRTISGPVNQQQAKVL